MILKHISVNSRPVCGSTTCVSMTTDPIASDCPECLRVYLDKLVERIGSIPSPSTSFGHIGLRLVDAIRDHWALVEKRPSGFSRPSIQRIADALAMLGFHGLESGFVIRHLFGGSISIPDAVHEAHLATDRLMARDEALGRIEKP